MNYEDQFNALEQSQGAQDLVVEYLALKEGEHVVGKLIAIEEVKLPQYEKPCNRYILDTDKGPASVLMGGATDKNIEGKLHIGWLTYIKFEGKRSLGDDRKPMNWWTVKQVDPDAAQISGADDRPLGDAR